MAAFAAAAVALLVTATLFQALLTRALSDRVDAELQDRAETAPILAAIADRLAQSELSGTVKGARVSASGIVTEVGSLPDDELPATIEPGWETVSADGQRWRLHTIEVTDVPAVGDRAMVQLVEPLGDVEAQTRRLRRQIWIVGLLAAMVAGTIGYAFGSVASQPITTLRRDAARLTDAEPDRWRVGTDYGSPEVDEVAATLNSSLARLAEETKRRGAALESARAFASSATHELRVPLQGALSNLEVAADERLTQDDRADVLNNASDQLQRVATALGAVRALAEAEFADPTWFETVDLVELVDAVVAEEAHLAGAEIELVTEPEPELEAPVVWSDGVRLAVGNVIRNAVRHGRPADGSIPRIVVTVDGARVSVDDNGPGIASEDRQRVLRRFERGSANGVAGRAGSGLGLTIAHQVTTAHGGRVEIDRSPLGGARVALYFG